MKKLASANLSLEFRARDDAPAKAITFEILGGIRDQSSVFEIYAHEVGEGSLKFPLLTEMSIFQRFDNGHNAKEPDWTTDRFRTEPFFESQKFYSMIAVQRNADNSIIGYSNVRTFYMLPDNKGIWGTLTNRYMVNWPSPDRVIITSRAGNQTAGSKDGWFVDKDGDAYWLAQDGQRGARVPDEDPRRQSEIFAAGFDPFAPEYLVFANRQGILLPDGEAGVGRYVNKFFMSCNDITPNAHNPATSGRDETFNATVSNWERWNQCTGIVTTEIDINSLLP